MRRKPLKTSVNKLDIVSLPYINIYLFIFAVEHQASAFQVDDLERELEQLRESNRAIQAEKCAIQAENSALQQQITRMKSELDDKERQLQQQGEEINDLRSTIEERRQIDFRRHEMQEKQIADERLARNLQQSERAREEALQLRHQYDSGIQIHDDSLHMTGSCGGNNNEWIGCLINTVEYCTTFSDRLTPEGVCISDLWNNLYYKGYITTSGYH